MTTLQMEEKVSLNICELLLNICELVKLLEKIEVEELSTTLLYELSVKVETLKEFLLYFLAEFSLERRNEKKKKKMKIKEMLEFIQMLHDGYCTDYFYLALRFENKERETGDIITENSKHNADRSDERDFPEFGTKEYDELEELDGISAWVVGCLKNMYRYQLENDVTSLGWKHAYFIGSDEVGYTSDDIILDHGEILLKNAVVLAKLF